MTTAPVPAAQSLADRAERSKRGSGAQPAAAGLFTGVRLRLWLTKSAFSVVDQGFTALAGFSVSFLLARWLSPETYGAYAIAFAAYLFICGFHNAIVLEPMSVYGTARHSSDLRRYFRMQLQVHAVLASALSAIAVLLAAVVWLLAPRSPLAGAIFGSALALPLLLLLWVTRRMCYVLQRPRIALFGSVGCFVTVLAGLYVLRYLQRLTPFSAFMLTAGGSLLGAILILVRVARRHGGAGHPAGAFAPSVGAPVSWRATLRENWSYGRWLFGTAILYPVSGQVQMFLAAAFLGLGSAGALRAMMIPAAVMTQVVSATDLLILPGFSYDFGRGSLLRMRRKALLISCALGGAGLCFALVLLLVAAPAEHLLFSGKFAAYVWLMPVLALIPAINGFNSGFSATLRGSQKPHFDLVANAIAAPVAVISALFLIRAWGLAGAAMSLVVGCATLAFVNFCSYCHLALSARGQESAPLPPATSLESAS